jgi:hypothetical protein
MSELIKDPVYRKFLTTPPQLPAHAENKRLNDSPPWVVYVQRVSGGKWGKKEFWTYKKAFKFFRKALKLGVHDVTINNKRVGSPPPSKWVRVRGKYVVGSDGVKRQATKLVFWKPKLEADDGEHHWCKYCRRPTTFKYYISHKRLGPVTSDVLRCCICGASERIDIHTPSDKMFRVH